MDANENCCAIPQQESAASGGNNENAEVRKLQDLVRRLELQNAQLRMSQAAAAAAASKDYLHHPPNGVLPVDRVLRTSDECCEDEDDDFNTSGLLDDVDLIDVEQLELSDEDSWLYQSPNSLTPEQKAISPYKWLRSDVEDPTNVELQIAKRALVTKIEGLIQASIVNSNQTSRPSKTYLTPSLESTNDRIPEPCLRTPLCARLSSYGGNAQSIDTRTFTRPKKSPITLDLPVVDSASDSASASARVNDRRPLTPPPSLTDVSEIHTIARLQEECLRQCSPPPTPRRNSGTSTSSQRSAKSLVTDHDASLRNNRSATTTTAAAAAALSGQSSAASMSPPVSPQGSQYLEEIRTIDTGVGRRSLPNLPRPYNGVSVIQAATGAAKSFNSVTAAVAAASNCDMASTNHQVASATAPRSSMSPLRKAGAIPRSASPATRPSAAVRKPARPAADDAGGNGGSTLASRIPKPRQTRSAIPMRSAYIRAAAEESWKDGCY